MPINYGSQIAEHEEVRKSCGIFDVSHMAIIDFKGTDARNFIRKLIANDVDSLIEDYDGMYSSMLNEKAGIIDDLIAYKMEFGYRLVVNCARQEEDLKWIFSCSSGFEVEVVEREDLAMISIQGPKSSEILDDLGLDILDSRKRQQGTYIDDVLAVKTGYTGEKGFEVILPNNKSEMFWEKALKAGVERDVGHEYLTELEDRFVMLDNFHSEISYGEQLKDAFDWMYKDASEDDGRIFSLSLHPWVIGQPHRIGILEDFFD